MSSDEGGDYEFEWGNLTFTVPEGVGDLWYELKATSWGVRVILMLTGLIVGAFSLLFGLYMGYKSAGVL